MNRFLKGFLAHDSAHYSGLMGGSRAAQPRRAPWRLIAVVLALALAMMACWGGGGSSAPVVLSSIPTPTSTPTPPTTLTVESNPPGALVELNPQHSSSQSSYLPGTGRSIGATPLSATLQSGDFVVSGGCATLIVYVHAVSGYYGAVDNISACLAAGQTGTPVPRPSYDFNTTLAPCPADTGPNCGNS